MNISLFSVMYRQVLPPDLISAQTIVPAPPPVTAATSYRAGDSTRTLGGSMLEHRGPKTLVDAARTRQCMIPESPTYGRTRGTESVYVVLYASVIFSLAR
jgi:hypothetical protein